MKLPKCVIEFLYRQMMQRVAQKRAPDVLIGGAEDAYMRRWHVIPRNKWFNIYLHNVLKSDDDRALHDHPWINMSIIMKGGYIEMLPTRMTLENGDSETDYQITYGKFREPGTVLLRGPKTAHRLVVGYDPVIWTLFITGPKTREWGFWCPQGWKSWKKFTAYETGDRYSRGPGCD